MRLDAPWILYSPFGTPHQWDIPEGIYRILPGGPVPVETADRRGEDTPGESGGVFLEYTAARWFLRVAAPPAPVEINRRRTGAAGRHYELAGGDEIRVADAVYYLLPPGTVVVKQAAFCLMVDCLPYISLPAIMCNQPAVTWLRIVNTSPAKLDGVTIRLSLKGQDAQTVLTFGDLAPQASERVCHPELAVPLDRLNQVAGYGDIILRLQVDAAGKPKHAHLAELPLRFINRQYWPHSPEYQTSLACYINPHNFKLTTLLNRMPAGAASRQPAAGSLFELASSGSADRHRLAAESLYTYLLQNVEINFRRPEVLLPEVQQIQDIDTTLSELPNDAQPGKAVGSCIDLAILLAAGLEALRMKPLLAVIRENGANWHVLVGLWQSDSERYRPLYRGGAEIERLFDRRDILLFDPNSLTRYYGRKESFAESVSRAGALLQEKPGIFVLDVAACRLLQVAPLQFSLAPEVREVRRLSEQIAVYRQDQSLESKHLLWALLVNLDEPVKSLLKSAGLSEAKLAEVQQQFAAAAKTSAPVTPLSETLNFRSAIHQAQDIAIAQNQHLATCRHLCHALAKSNSQNVSNIFSRIGVSILHLEGLLSKMIDGPRSITEDF